MIKINKNGGGNRNRTDDILLAKQTLYHLSYTPRKWSPVLESNQLKRVLQTLALPFSQRGVGGSDETRTRDLWRDRPAL
jgi:hypothetical protein